MRDFRARARAGERLCGTFIGIPHPVAVEVTARAGVEFLCLDWEHAQISRGRIEDLLRAAEVAACPAIVRVPGHGPEAIAAALDAGAAGVLVPRVSTEAEARAAVAAVRYPPLGARGAGPGRAAGYGYDIAAYLARANDEILLAVQVETAEGLANIDAIAAVEGIDVVFIGPGDLSVSLGAFGPEGKATLDAAIARILQGCRAAGRAAGLFYPDASRLAEARALGVSFLIVGSDAMFLGAALRSYAAEIAATADGAE
ncbi:HpcH/HpaI aldolase family protein [Acidimangrovimonas sediminis]|uniref:HpcH/HpaI aldolase family protein n=1 Tax=Acidimangrovimonas sediminis TaxID=2056283 RepID=UPI000C800B88|nr:aldolase/citrate lyase family protein [Acidimangrovimonas sediminis]